MTVISLAIFGLWFANGNNANAQAINEGFESVAGLPAAGWVSTNRSQPLGASVWTQCTGTAIPPAQAGPANSCALVNFNSTTGVGTISNWLIAPNRTFSNGDTVSFFTRTPNNNFPDRLQLRLSTNGASTNVGTTATDVGDFTTLLVDIDPTYSGTYPLVWTQFTATITGLAGPTSGRVAFRYFVEGGGPDGDNSNIIGIDTFAYTPGVTVTPGDAPVDFNGDGKTDWSVTRNIGGQVRWYYNTNGTGAATVALDWGLPTDRLVPADYDGDQKDDVAVWRPSDAAWYILQSQTNTLRAEVFGQTGDDPTVVGDYNGDGKDDLAVYRPGAAAGDQSNWFYRTAPGGTTTTVTWGSNGDKAAPGDYNGDGTADFAVARNNGGGQLTYWTMLSTGAISTPVFGTPTDTVVTGDFDGDSKTDLAVVRSSGGALTWYWRPSSGGADQQTTFGLSTDIIAVGDYDGDAKADAGVWRDGIFWVRSTTSGAISNFNLGSAGDSVPANFNAH